MRLAVLAKLALTFGALWLASGNAWSQGTEGLRSWSTDSDWSSDREILVRMRDGIRLSTDVHLPKQAAGKLPTILIRTPYTKSGWMHWSRPDIYGAYLKGRYAVVVQAERGTEFSEGQFNNYLQGASTDGYDTIQWIVKQPWSNGKVGAMGCSSPGETLYPAAASNPPGFAAMVTEGAGFAVGDVPGNETRGAFYRGGVPLLGMGAWWYGEYGPTERLLMPPNATQQQRIWLVDNHTDKYATTGPKGRLDGSDLSAYMHLPSVDVTRAVGAPDSPLNKYLTWGPADKGWNDVEHIGAGAKPRVPALHVNNWHDLSAGETTRLFEYLQDLNTPHQYLILGAGPHCAPHWGEKGLADLKFGDLHVGDARYGGKDHGYADLYFRWFDYWLNGNQNQVTEMPKVQLYVMGRGWISSDRWPLKEVRPTNYYLSRDATSSGAGAQSGVLLSDQPARNEKDSYLYDPAVPVPSVGGGCCSAAAYDQRPVEARRDVLVYSTLLLEKPVTIAGPIEVVLHVSSSAKDTDFMVRLVDVYPDGKAINLSDDAFRVRYREGFDKKVLMRPGEVYPIRLTNMVTAVRFAKGHRIRLDISSSSFPEYERNLNTGGDNYNETKWVVTENSIHHGPRYLSRVVLPVLPDKGEQQLSSGH
jgi:uncharacterized protein